MDNARWKGKYANPIGLSRLLETYEEFSLLKGKVQISNWEKSLDLRQQECASHSYSKATLCADPSILDAANDCHAGLVLYNRLIDMTTALSHTPEKFWYTFDTIMGLQYQPSSGILWHPYNPYYDPGPPPPPRPPRPDEGDYIPGDDKPQRGERFRNRRRGPERPLSPTAPSFVPGAKEHSPSPSPSPHPGFAPRGRAPPRPAFPHASHITVAQIGRAHV